MTWHATWQVNDYSTTAEPPVNGSGQRWPTTVNGGGPPPDLRRNSGLAGSTTGRVRVRSGSGRVWIGSGLGLDREPMVFAHVMLIIDLNQFVIFCLGDVGSSGHAVGNVMGRGRANVDNIHKISKAFVEISDNKSSCGDRVAIISGKPE
ncbi:KH domain-containing protein [Tanacetum coccineum]